MDDLIRRAAEDLAAAGNVAALTGAGISIESGIPPFRGKGGLWERFDPMEFAHIDALMRDPAKVWKVLVTEMKEIVDRAKPNDAHKGLAKLEKQNKLKTIITQNIDGLHQAAGSTDVIEFHGNFAWQRCMDCDARIETVKVDMSRVPPLCECGGIYRPECIFFGEILVTLRISLISSVTSVRRYSPISSSSEMSVGLKTGYDSVEAKVSWFICHNSSAR